MEYEEGALLHAILKRLAALDAKLDAIVAATVTDPGTLAALTKQLAESQAALDAALKSQPK